MLKKLYEIKVFKYDTEGEFRKHMDKMILAGWDLQNVCKKEGTTEHIGYYVKGEGLNVEGSNTDKEDGRI